MAQVVVAPAEIWDSENEAGPQWAPGGIDRWIHTEHGSILVSQQDRGCSLVFTELGAPSESDKLRRCMAAILTQDPETDPEADEPVDLSNEIDEVVQDLVRELEKRL